MQGTPAIGWPNRSVIIAREIEEHRAGPFCSRRTIGRTARHGVEGPLRVFDVLVEPLDSPPMHFHKYDEVFEIVDGNMTFCCDGELIEAGTGAVVVVPAGTYHSWINRSGDPVAMRIKAGPGEFDEMIFRPKPGLSHPEFCTFAASCGIFVIGPPLVG